jgi:hypothetical protein
MSYFCGARGLVRHKNNETNDWGLPGVDPTILLWRMRARCATKISYFYGARKAGAPQK